MRIYHERSKNIDYRGRWVHMVKCQFCGETIIRRLNEHSGRYSNRKFCNHNCEGKSQRKANPSYVALSARARVVALKDNCENCGGTNRLAVHHLDRNRFNDSKENLKTLCNNCHSKLHMEEDEHYDRTGPKCIICNDTGYAFGLCQKHYQRFKANGSPLITYIQKTGMYEIDMED